MTQISAVTLRSRRARVSHSQICAMDMDESQSLEALSNILTELTKNPNSLSLYARYFNLAQSNGVDDEDINPVRQMLTTYWPANDDVWLPIIEGRVRQGVNALEDTLEVLDLFEAAEDDYFCMCL